MEKGHYKYDGIKYCTNKDLSVPGAAGSHPRLQVGPAPAPLGSFPARMAWNAAGIAWNAAGMAWNAAGMAWKHQAADGKEL